MTLRSAMVVAVAAGLAVPAWGQPDELTGIPVHIQDNSRGTYGDRAMGMPIDNWTNANHTGLFLFLGEANGKHIMDDFYFAPGPWASQLARTIDGVDFAIWSNLGADFKVRMRIWDMADINYAGFASPGGDMINPSGTPLRDWMVFPTTYNYFGEGFVQINVALPGGSLAIPGTVTGIAVEVQTIDPITELPGASVPGATFTSNNSARGAATNSPLDSVNPCAPGFSLVDYARDINNDGVFTGDAGQDEVGERRTLIRSIGGPTPWATFAYSFGLRGDITGVSAPACESLSVGADNVWSSDTETLGANGLKWYCLTLASSANDANYKYIDFQTQGSTDVAIAVFDTNGIMVATDDEKGGGGNAQLSFGMGRRTADGGSVFDGINYFPTQRGQSPGTDGLLAGTYYIAVASASNSAVFGDGFYASGGGAGGTTTLRWRTNVTGGALATSEAPAATRIIGLGLEDPIIAPGGQSASVALYSPDTQWYDVQLCRDADGSNAVSFYVSAPAATESPGKCIYVFDDQGNLRGMAQGGRPSTPTVNFGGSDPALAAGRYFICTTFDYSGSDVDIAPNAASNGRWHVRPRVNDGGYTLQVTVIVPWADCPATCDPDVNCDGSANGVDVEVQELAVGGDFTDYCQVGIPNVDDGDFNRDGAVNGTDVEAVENAVGGVCP
ncbi:MAG: hypothetical protein HBSAPP03_20420 [Phycisphaerae bacterium]|nr:MAG: hypothetical protein HBSAPP03_20420 [Phycisphaerae bacterium]